MRIFKVVSAQFGNIHSIFCSVRIGEAICRSAINKILQIPCQIYIDDSIILAREERLEVYMASTKAVYSELGIWLSHEKDESHITTELLTVLGLGFRRHKEISMHVFAPEEKIEKSISKID